MKKCYKEAPDPRDPSPNTKRDHSTVYNFIFIT